MLIYVFNFFQDVEKVTTFLRTHKYLRSPLEEMDESALNKYMSIYIMGAKRDDGEEYEPDTLSSIVRSVAR